MPSDSIETTVYERLKRSIANRLIRPGAQLVEASIASSMGVSRTPVRVALRRLAAEGLVEAIEKKGTFVAQPTVRGAHEIWPIRLSLEGLAARLAAHNPDRSFITKLEDLCEKEYESYSFRDINMFLEVNNDIHLTIAQASLNSVLARYIAELVFRSNIYLIFDDQFFRVPIEEIRSMGEHREIIRAIKVGDPDKAEAAMKWHTESTLCHIDLHSLEALAIGGDLPKTL